MHILMGSCQIGASRFFVRGPRRKIAGRAGGVSAPAGAKRASRAHSAGTAGRGEM